MMSERTAFVLVTTFLAVGCAEAQTDGPGEGGDVSAQGGSSEGGATLGGSGEGGASAGGAGGGEPVERHCAPEDGESIDPNCGLFVDPSASAGGNGSQNDPYRTLTAAIVAAGDSDTAIYVCTGSLAEAVVIPPSVDVHGGLLCSDDAWRWYLDVRTEWTAAPDEVPLTVRGALTEDAPSRITGFDITAADGAVVSDSSIASVVDGGFVAFERVSLTAGHAVDGQPTMGGQAPGGMPGQGGGDGVGAFSKGPGGESSCASDGGDGGRQLGLAAQGGEQGLPAQGNGGASTGSGSDIVCNNGGPGAQGMPGQDGVSATGLGLLDSSGFHPASGTSGEDGDPGGGGGGGGAIFNHAGGGGGAGGCGGTGGVAGTGGGSSIALAVIDASVTFLDVRAEAGQAGNGGFGWSGGSGALGGTGGQGDGNACDGGSGANGGNGGRGGDGAGGHAILIAHTGAAPLTDGLNLIEPEPSQAGAGPGDAPEGVAAVSYEFALSNDR